MPISARAHRGVHRFSIPQFRTALTDTATPETVREDGRVPLALRRAWKSLTAPVATATLTAAAAAAIGAPTAAANGPAAVTAGATASAALIVGGTTYPTVEESLMQQLWPIWARSLGLVDTASTSLVNVTYPAQLAPFTDGDALGASVSAGVDSLLTLLDTTYAAGQHLIVWGISQGALVLGMAEEALANDPSAPPADALTFVRVADPASAVTGLLNFLPNLIMSQLLQWDTAKWLAPNDSRYDNIVVIAEYDAFADFPDQPWNLLAIANALVGLVYRHGQTGEADLTTVPSQNISTTVNSLGATTTTYVVPSPFLPLTQLLRDAGLPGGVVDDLDAVLRPIIDAGYTRNGAKAATAVAVTAEANLDPQPATAVPLSPAVAPEPRVATDASVALARSVTRGPDARPLPTKTGTARTASALSSDVPARSRPSSVGKATRPGDGSGYRSH